MPHHANLCIDGNVNSFCHSLDQDSPWLSVQLPAGSTVSHVVVHNRYGMGQARLSPFQLWVGAYAGDVDSPTSSACGINNLTAPATPGPFAFSCGSLSGDYVTLVLPGPSRTLNLGEIIVYSPS